MGHPNRPKIHRRRVGRLVVSTLGLYRYALLAMIGLVIFGVGFYVSFRELFMPTVGIFTGAFNAILRPVVGDEPIEATNHILGGIFLVFGTFALIYGSRTFMRRLVETFEPSAKSGIVGAYIKRKQLAQGPRIVVLGGGSGLSTLLRGLKQYSSNLTAIVTVTDDGGSSGRLVQEMGIIPPGDIRNCLVALADAERRMTDLFQHRFKKSAGALSGHSVGNLFIAGLIEQCDGDVEQALQVASEVLAIRGKVVPSTMDRVRLRAVMEDGSEICGETAIVSSSKRIRRIFLDPEDVAVNPAAIEAIKEAELICIGPGSVYTSVIPNLLVPGMSQALAQAKCPSVYICNVMTQFGESDSFTAAEHLVALQANVDRKVCDYILVNDGTPSPEAIARYRASQQQLVEPDLDRVRQLGYRAVTGDLISETDVVRHDPMRVAAKLMDILG